MSVPEYVFEQTLRAFFAPIERSMEDDLVSEILINGHEEVYVERNGVLERTLEAFQSEHALMCALRNLAQFVGRDFGPSRPVLEGRLPDGSRVEAVIPPASQTGPAICIRRVRSDALTLERLIEEGALSPLTARWLRASVWNRQNIVIGGGSGSGKTALLEVLASVASPSDRVIVIEDARELRLSLPHVVHLQSRPQDSEGRGGITIRELLHATLRMRPDRILIGEIRGGEALDLIQAMTSGHRGCLSTLHGTLPLDTLSRLETMALMGGVQIPTAVLRTQIASAIDVLVQVARLPSGRRLLTHVAEVRGFDLDRGYHIEPVFESEERT